jgi:hypothetical protein
MFSILKVFDRISRKVSFNHNDYYFLSTFYLLSLLMDLFFRIIEYPIVVHFTHIFHLLHTLLIFLTKILSIFHALDCFYYAQIISNQNVVL